MKNLIKATEREFFFEKFFLDLPIKIVGENPTYVNAEFRNGKIVRYDISLTGEICDTLEINHMHLLPTNIWSLDDKFLFERIMKKNERIAKQTGQSYLVVNSNSIGKSEEGWLREMDYAIQGNNRNYFGVKKLK